jgi:methoxymalonate biosynthesis acyl carrier protein
MGDERMAVSTENAAAEIREWLRHNVTGGRQVPPDEPLIENGVLTSLQTVELVTFLEERFGIIVEDEEFDEVNFGSVEAIARLAANKTR